MGPQPAARWAVLGLLFGAPVSAEYLQAYLTSTGDALELLVGLILAPLYGGAALVIREVAVRTGRGWPGILLLAGAFGVIMPGLVDLSLFTEHETDVTGWDELWSPTSVPLLGISVHSGIAWALGHVVMSIGVPIALLEALAPKLRGRSLLGREGLVVVVILWLASAALVHSDSRGPGSTPHPAQVAGVLAVAIGLVLLARTRLGRPVRRRVEGRAWGTTPQSDSDWPPCWQLICRRRPGSALSCSWSWSWASVSWSPLPPGRLPGACPRSPAWPAVLWWNVRSSALWLRWHQASR